MISLYVLSLRQLATVRRLAVLVVLGILPVFISAVLAGNSDSISSFVDDVLLTGVITAAIVPLITLAVGTAAFGNELDDNTLSNLTLSPFPRWKIVAPKLDRRPDGQRADPGRQRRYFTTDRARRRRSPGSGGWGGRVGRRGDLRGPIHVGRTDDRPRAFGTACSTSSCGKGCSHRSSTGSNTCPFVNTRSA